jgi:hypothetical protein
LALDGCERSVSGTLVTLFPWNTVMLLPIIIGQDVWPVLTRG